MVSSDDFSPPLAGTAGDDLEARYAELETAWQRGDQPTLGNFLPPHEPARTSAIKSLAPMDFEYRFAQDQDTRVEVYLQQYPQLSDDRTFLEEFIGWEAELRRSANQALDVAEYIRRFPQVPEEELRACLEANQADGLPTHVDQRPAEPANMPPLDSVVSEVPAQIGRYRIVRRLGQGGFGCVYLAHDEQLNREVAIKAPLRRLGDDPSTLDRFLKEAQLVASLDHHAIVPVYDFGTWEEQRYFIVSKFISGGSLAEKLKSHRLPFRQSAALVATVADALQYAHERKICHRDVKPANILLDEAGRVFLTDFGLALTVDGLASDDRMAGTPIYMSPEQAAGEGHRIDGRSDVFSLGSVLYKLLCGEPHTVGRTVQEVLHKIQFVDTRPPRQLDRKIPGELERICLRALARRPADRYTAAADMADDLRAFLASEDTSPFTVPSRDRRTDGERSCRIVPKGLRSFDEDDHDFFLQLLPGPRDRDGVPNKIRFWKDRIEEHDASLTFNVGLIYGPSGCGKSSFVKAGLLPLLSEQVTALYVESTGDQTEARLTRVLDRRFAELAGMATLKDRLSAVRRRQVPLHAGKLLIVLDQFEQWLHSQPIEETSDLVQALRECDGIHVQCVLMVRDDFWMPVTRFFQKLDILLRENDNSAAVDLFDVTHATKVLRLFGIAYDRLPDRDLSEREAHFLQLAVDGLAESGWVMCVRLALFAEMMRGRPWSAESLAQIGGATGVGLAYLEETFTGPTAPPSHRMHQQAARNVLKALLPESGSNIRGRACLEEELRLASGYQAHPDDFSELMRILDNEIRLLTPTVTDGNGESDDKSPPDLPVSLRRYYQLTHDFLVVPLRDWLTRKQKETRRGRAQLLLEERAATWKANPQRRHLPSWWESLQIALLTSWRRWNESERKMMRSAGSFHGMQTAFIATMTSLVLAFGTHTISSQLETHRQQQQRELLDQLTKSNVDWSRLPKVIDEMRENATGLTPVLKQEFLASAPESARKLSVTLALLEFRAAAADQEYVDYAFQELLVAEPEQFKLLRKALAPKSQQLTEPLWNVLEGQDGDPPHQRLRAAATLANYDPANPRWQNVAQEVTRQLLDLNPVQAGRWQTELQSVAEQLMKPLADEALDPAQPLARSILLAWVKNGTPAVRLAAIRGLQLASAGEPSEKGQVAEPGDTAPTLSEQARTTIEQADGKVTDSFAYCHGLTREEFDRLRPELTESHYRPVSVRPYSSGEVTRMAVVWTRDAQKWDWKLGTAKEITATNDDLSAHGYMPLDVAGWLPPDAAAEVRYAALWVEKDSSSRQLCVGEPEATFARQIGNADGTAEAPSLLCFSQVSSGESRYFSAIETNDAAAPTSAEVLFGEEFQDNRYPGLLQVDVQLNRGSGTRRQEEHLRNQRRLQPDAPDQAPIDALHWAKAVYYTSRFAPAEPVNTDDLDKAAGFLFVILHRSQLPKDRLRETAKWHVLLLAALGRRDGCRIGLERLRQYESDSYELAFVRAMSACLLDADNFEKAREAVREQLEPFFSDARFLYGAARVLAVAGEFARGRSAAESDACLAESVELLHRACAAGFSQPGELAREADLDPLRDRPDFQSLLVKEEVDQEYAVAWQVSTEHESQENHGLPISKHLAWCQQQERNGYYPVRIAVLDRGREGKTAASIWHRPLVPLQQQLLQTRRQAAQAVVQFQLGVPDDVRKGFASPADPAENDPTLRSYLVSLLKQFGTEDKKLVDLLVQETDPHVQCGLVHTLGQYQPTDLDGETQTTLEAMLERLYRNTDDNALRASIQWLLRTWKQQDRLAKWDLQLRSDNDRRRDNGSWYVTDDCEGPTMIPIKGGSFVMGSPGWEAYRSDNELPHSATIPRCFRMSATPVTRAQFKRFLEDKTVEMESEEQRKRLNERFASPQFNRLCPQGDSPMVGVTWYLAAQYCNWLSRKEQVEPCYVAEHDLGKYAEGMSPAADFVLKSGFRLPTEAEWEYACRAGTATVRYFGNDEELLPDYAWFRGNAGRTPEPVGTRIPNGFGLFDMLGNVWTWCGDRYLPYEPDAFDHGDSSEVNQEERIVRGGSVAQDPAQVRAAFRGAALPDKFYDKFVGFRIVQTISPTQ